MMKKGWLKKEVKEELNQPSAVEDCADVTSRYKRYKKHQNTQFPPIKYEKPPHH